MRLVAISDFHGYLPEIPECDLLLIAGDVCPIWNHERRYQADWLRTEFSEWLQDQPARAIVGIGGNHDFVLSESKIGYELPWIYLDGEETTLGQFHDDEQPITIYGSPLSNQFGNWAFMTSEDKLRKHYKNIPSEIDILMTHGPAWGYGDEVKGFDMIKRGMISKQHVGSTSLTNRLTYDEWPNLKLHFFGHIHGGFGKYDYGNGITGYNVAYMDDDYKIRANDPVVIDL
jgi:hypothetical protein